jgi:3-methyl-2-oxobutanoate hydroxymethyltransferase
MDDMLRHTRAVSRGTTRALVIGDMPFMSYQVSAIEAVRNAGRFLKEAGAHAVKLEGGLEMADTIRAICRAGIPVMAHIGLTPQSIQAMGGYRMHGKSDAEQDYLVQSAHAVADAGAFAVVLECVVPELAQRITKAVSIPTIGIGSGTVGDGQVLVTQDLLGLTAGRTPSFVQPEARLSEELRAGVARYVARTKGVGTTVGNA